MPKSPSPKPNPKSETLEGTVVLDPGTTIEETYGASEVGVSDIPQIAILNPKFIVIRSGDTSWRLSFSENEMEIMMTNHPSRMSAGLVMAPQASNVVIVKPNG